MHGERADQTLDDDHDLLNFGETGGRLRAEIAAVEAALAAAEDADAGERRAAAEARLTALRAALARNNRNAAARPGETDFLAYVPPGRADPPSDGTAAPPEE
ncbi:MULTISPECIES: hypothetical protein [unclassified Parafrankia]|uniref:hypothetical protein n=1 Tax=unclassified Parafrankia TaxID=2994368 RepID=UPI000DA4CACE|nr:MULTISPECIES: hypothetical protein [unclassified Parafrankia]SQD99813.1 conserved hypothetical protein [Parafrankia sp. Ea1.12]